MKQSQHKKRLLRIHEAAAYCGLHPQEIRARVADKSFPFRNISRGRRPVFRFDVRELDRWIEQLPGFKVEDLNP